MSDEFCITLPSNVFSKEDPNNTPSKFVTRLNRTIQLSGDWEVAATRLQLQNRWYNITKPQLLGVYVRDVRTFGSSTYSAGSELRTGQTAASQPQKEKSFNRLAHTWKKETWAIDFLQNMTYRCVTFPPGVYESLEQIGTTLIDQIVAAFTGTFDDLEMKYIYHAAKNTAELSIVAEKDSNTFYVVRVVTLTSSKDLDVMETLGFAKQVSGDAQGDIMYGFYGWTLFPSKEELADMEFPRLIKFCGINNKLVNHPAKPEVRQLMLYADVAALRNVGNIEAQLLDTVVVNAKLGEHEDVLRGVTPNYVPVYRNTISTIEIVLTDYAGDPLLFPRDYSSPVIVTLRFRKRNSGS